MYIVHVAQSILVFINVFHCIALYLIKSQSILMYFTVIHCVPLYFNVFHYFNVYNFNVFQCFSLYFNVFFTIIIAMNLNVFQCTSK